MKLKVLLFCILASGVQHLNQPEVSAQKSVKRQQPLGVHPGWFAEKFPDESICYLAPAEIRAAYSATLKKNRKAVTSYEKPKDGSLRIVGTGHSFMMPGFKTLPVIARGAGLKQPPLMTHTGGGETGSVRYKWEQENGIFRFKGRAKPKLLASISNAKWDAMMWGPWYNDRPEYYRCWIDFCLKHNPDMKFYLSDAWPQLNQMGRPKSDNDITYDVVAKIGRDRFSDYKEIIDDLNKEYNGKVFILPTCEAMVLAVKYYHEGKLPGVEGIHALVGRKRRSLWRDRIGHLGPGFANLEGYVFYAAMYGRSPELIKDKGLFKNDGGFPSAELDGMFRKIAWEAVLRNSLSGVVDKNGNKIADALE